MKSTKSLRQIEYVLFRFMGRYSIYGIIPNSAKEAFIHGQMDRFRDKEVKLLEYKAR